MKTIQLCAAVACAALLAQPAMAQFGGLGGLGGMKMPSMGGGGGGGADIDGFLITTLQAEELVRRSSLAVLDAVGSHEKVLALRENAKAAAAIPDPKEREAAMRRVDADAQAQLAMVDYDAKAKELEGSVSADQRRQLGAAIYNLFLGILKDKEAVQRGQALTQSLASNPMGMAMQGGKLLRVKDAAGSIGGQMSNLLKIAGGLPKLMSVAKLNALPTSSSDQPKDVSDQL